MVSVNLESIKSSGLEKRIRSSIFSRHYKTIDSYIQENLRKEGDNFFIPTVEVVTDRDKNLEQELIELYDRKFPCNTDDIDYDIKLLQASVLDGLVVGINLDRGGEFQIYTANIGTIFGIKESSKFNLDKALELNRKRIVHAVRVDIDYTSEDGFNYKIVSLNKNTNLHIVDVETNEGRFHLVPYIVIQRSMSYFKEMLDDMRIVNVLQDKGEVKKERYITCRKDVLVRYCDSEEFVKSLKPSYFPLKGFFYAPVIGASSLSSGLTRVDLLDVCNINSVSSVEGLCKQVDGLGSYLSDNCISSILEEMYENDIVGYEKLVYSFPNSETAFTGAVYDIDKGVPNPISVMNYIHGLKSKDKKKLESMIPNLEEKIESKKTIFNKYEEIDVSNLSNEKVKELLKEGVFKFLIRKKDCTYSSLTLSNNPSILKKLYGNDYFGKYESLGVRIRRLENCLSNQIYGGDDSLVGHWLVLCGFPSDESVCSKVVELWKEGVIGKELHESLLRIFSKPKTSSRKSTRRSSSNEDLILARVCSATLTSAGSRDFYRYLDMNKVVSMYRIG